MHRDAVRGSSVGGPGACIAIDGVILLVLVILVTEEYSWGDDIPQTGAAI